MSQCTHSATQGLAANGEWYGDGPAPTEGHVLCRDCGAMVTDPLVIHLGHDDCLEHRSHPDCECRGPVEYRMPLSGTGRAFPRCAFHWDKRLDEQERINRTYPQMAPSPTLPDVRR